MAGVLAYVDVLRRSQMVVAGIRCRPRSGHRADEDTRITTYRQGETTTAVRSRTARLPSTRHDDAPPSGGRRVMAW
ncbi:hypothetical protein ADL12_42025 [Streptomyces regalis]|uniref:Uncharacterized protein n=1 Tax=Streptomyces regalis TaxID=68262 RepID=A0A117MKL2_9ACTN|nr:hypothetical protein ADL12_42025 [Streptomyces regalis]